MILRNYNVSAQNFPNYLALPVPYVDVSQTVERIPSFNGIVIPIVNTQGRVREVIEDVPVIVPFDTSNTDFITPRQEEDYEPTRWFKRVEVRKNRPVCAPKVNVKYKPSTSYSTTDEAYTEYAPRYSYEYSPRFRRFSIVLPVFNQVNYDSYYYAVGQRQRALWRAIREIMR